MVMLWREKGHVRGHFNGGLESKVASVKKGRMLQRWPV